MPSISAAAHRVLDFATIAVFVTAPSVLALDSIPRVLSYGLAAVHLMMTIATRFESSRRPLPLAAHGHVEITVAIGLLVAAAAAPWPMRARWFFAAAGAAIAAVWVMSDYSSSRSRPRGF